MMSSNMIGLLIFCIPHIVGLLLCAWAGFLYHITEDVRYKKIIFHNDNPLCAVALLIPIISQIVSVFMILAATLCLVVYSGTSLFTLFLNLSSKFSLKETLKNSWFVKSSNKALEFLWSQVGE
jgi:hypothetical protein